jgi:hypothetical protein
VLLTAVITNTIASYPGFIVVCEIEALFDTFSLPAKRLLVAMVVTWEY